MCALSKAPELDFCETPWFFRPEVAGISISLNKLQKLEDVFC